MPYTDEMLAELGITEDDLSASYFDETSSGWQGVDSFTVNTEANEIIASVGHFTEFALTAGGADTTPPANPSGVSATAGAGKVTLSWTNPTDTDLDHVNIYRSTTEGTRGDKEVSSAQESYEDTGLTAGTVYYYTLTAVDAVGNESSGTSQVSATPQIQPTATTAPTTAPTSSAALPGTGVSIQTAALFYLSRLLVLALLFGAPSYLLLRKGH